MTKCSRCGRPVRKSTPVLIRAMATDREGMLLGPALPYGPSCARRILGPAPRRWVRPRPLDAEPVEVLPEQLPLFDEIGGNEEE